MTIPVEKTRTPKRRIPEAELGFGKFFTDHLFRMDYEEGKGWHSARVEPYGPITLDPAASVLHYGQAIFEGMKAFKQSSGMKIFRPGQHAARFARSAARLCIPPVDEKILLEGVKTLLRTDADWLPAGPGTSLYVRPVIFATEPFLGVRPAKSYTLLVFLSPVGAYFSGPARRLRIWVERERARAARGGIGGSKAAANYVASLLAAEEAKKNGFDQVLWLDGAVHRDLEEIGTMNVFAYFGGTLVTPALEGSILPGVTRDSVIQLARSWGIPVEERRLPLEELAAAHRAGKLEELFGTGTASVIAPIGEVAWDGVTMKLPEPKKQTLGERLQAEVAGIQRGERPDQFGWLEAV
jgi:branched-chain amino acid aminotransferase